MWIPPIFTFVRRHTTWNSRMRWLMRKKLPWLFRVQWLLLHSAAPAVRGPEPTAAHKITADGAYLQWHTRRTRLIGLISLHRDPLDPPAVSVARVVRSGGGSGFCLHLQTCIYQRISSERGAQPQVPFSADSLWLRGIVSSPGGPTSDLDDLVRVALSEYRVLSNGTVSPPYPMRSSVAHAVDSATRLEG